ncbi:MAG: linalool dehydratase/isomerase domain-containing protein [Candidatus Hodarchaeales archaeon]
MKEEVECFLNRISGVSVWIMVKRILELITKSKLLLILLIMSVALIGSIFVLQPVSPATPKFSKLNVPNKGVIDFNSYPKLEREVIGLWNSLRNLYDVTDLSNESVNDLSVLPDVLTQYFLAFTIYGASQIADSTPGYRSDYYKQVFEKIILMMNSTAMEELEWINPHYADDDYAGMGNGFRGPTNIMWTGHYALMQLLYYNIFRDSTFIDETTWFLDDWNNSLTATTTWDNQTSLDSQGRPLGLWKCGLIPCEPYIVFVQCNSIPFYTMRLYDTLFGTNYQEASLPGIDWWQEHMTDPNGVQIDGYFHAEPAELEKAIRFDLPTSYPNPAVTVGKPDWPKVASYGSAWASMFYYAFGETNIAKTYYNTWKDIFVHYTINDQAYTPNSYHYPNNFGSYDLIGNMFAYFAAKEFGDTDLFRRLENWFYEPFPGFWNGYEYNFDTSALGELGSFFNPILNFAWAWGHADSTLADLMDVRPDSYYNYPYISNTNVKEGLFVYQAYYDEEKEAFILTLEASDNTVLTFENFPNVQGVYSTNTKNYFTWSQDGTQMHLAVTPGIYSFVIV